MDVGFGWLASITVDSVAIVLPLTSTGFNTRHNHHDPKLAGARSEHVLIVSNLSPKTKYCRKTPAISYAFICHHMPHLYTSMISMQGIGCLLWISHDTPGRFPGCTPAPLTSCPAAGLWAADGTQLHPTRSVATFIGNHLATWRVCNQEHGRLAGVLQGSAC